MFIGEYSCKVDNKGMMMVPVKLREYLGNTEFIATKGLDNCIDVFPNEKWEEITEKLKELKMTNAKHRAYKRSVLSAATKMILDNQGRINLPAPLIEHSGIEKNVIVIGNDDRIEIWSEEKWKSYMNEKMDIIEDIADEIDF